MNDFADVLADADVEASVHVRDVDGPGEIGLRPDDPAVLASTVKVLVALEFARQVDAGQLDPAERSRVEAADRLGGTGFAGFMDDVETSLRDLAVSMMSVSDNTAADLLVDRVGLDNLKSLAAELGMAGARILGGPRRVLQDIAADLGAPSLAELAATLRRASDAELRRTRAYDPARTTAATPRDMTTLLSRVWRDEAGAPAACAQARALMGRQLKHRVAPAMPEEVLVTAKSGTLPGLRNEVAVAEYPDGSRYAVAVFTRLRGPDGRRSEVDAAIGRAARLAVDQLRRDRDSSNTADQGRSATSETTGA